MRTLPLLLFISIFLTSCSSNNEEQQKRIEKENIAVIEKYIRAVESNDLKTMTELLADNYVGYGPSFYDSINKAQAIENWKDAAENIYDKIKYTRTVNIAKKIEDGPHPGNFVSDWASLKITYKDGRDPVFLNVNVIYQVENGKITMSRTFYNEADVLAQSGYEYSLTTPAAQTSTTQTPDVQTVTTKTPVLHKTTTKKTDAETVTTKTSDVQKVTPQPNVEQMPTQTPPMAKSLNIYIFPTKNQNQATQDKDDADCYSWAVEQSGIDPHKPTKVEAAQVDKGPDGSAVVGASKGAAAGVAIGAIAGDAGKGAAIGAVAGGLAGRRAKVKADAQQQQKNNEAATQQQTAMSDSFKKAYTACMEGKGYTVK